MSLNLNFFYFQFSNVVALLGDFLGMIGLSWWILEKSQSASDLSLVIVPSMIFRLLIMPILGPIADHYSRKKVLILADLLSAVISLLIGLLIFYDIYQLELIILLNLFLTFSFALFRTSSMGIIPEIVPTANLQSAMAQHQMILTLGQIIGAPLAGLFIAFCGVKLAFLINALTFFMAMMIMSQMSLSTHSVNSLTLNSWKENFKEGFSYLKRYPLLIYMAFFMACLNFFMAPLGILLPYYTKIVRDLPAWYLGGLEGAIGLGAVLGTFLLGRMTKRFSSFYIVQVSFGLMGISLILFAYLPGLLLPLLSISLFGLMEVWSTIPVRTRIILGVPHYFRSRVGTLMMLGGQITAPLGVSLTSIGLDRLGLNSVIFIMGGALIILTPFLFIIPQFYRFLSSEVEESVLLLQKEELTK